MGVDIAAEDLGDDPDQTRPVSLADRKTDDPTNTGGSGGGALTMSGGASSAASGGSDGLSTGGETGSGGVAGTGGADATQPFFNDTFEDITLPPIYATMGTLKRTIEPIHDGTGALEINQGGLATVATIEHPFPELPENELYFRAHVLIAEGTLNGLMGLAEFTGPGGEMDLNVYSDRTLDVYFHQHLDEVQSEPEAFPVGQWFCLELTTYFDDVEGYVEVGIDGVVQARLEGYDTAPSTPYTHVRYGMPWTADNQQGGRIYWDNVALSASPLGCD